MRRGAFRTGGAIIAVGEGIKRLPGDWGAVKLVETGALPVNTSSTVPLAGIDHVELEPLAIETSDNSSLRIVHNRSLKSTSS